MNGFEFQIWRLQKAIETLREANARTPLFAPITDAQLLNLIYLVADADMTVDQATTLIRRINAGEILFVLAGK